ncbi:alpha/beta hydrolase [Saccharopolyspora halophila]|uniref:alpha/beta fold hydrolase n=1 Tax=Saccharopolyspora halophila TaxID=405551 RepID=UPI0031DE7718
MEGHVFVASSSPDSDVSADGQLVGGVPAHAGARAEQAVLMCPELVSAAELLPVDCSARLIDWSPRRNFTTEDHVADALSALDEAGVRECVVTAWSGGTGVAVELARRYPDRIRGLLLLAGPPTSGLELLLQTCGIPAGARRLLASGGATSLRLAGSLLGSLTAQLPTSELPVRWMERVGLLPDDGNRAATAAALARLVQVDWLGHAEMALAWSSRTREGLAGLTCPVTLLAGRYDFLAEPRSLARAVAALPQARIRFLESTHLIPFEAPDEVRAELDLLRRRTRAVDCARLGLEPPPPPIPRIRIAVPARPDRRRTPHPPE